MIVPRGPQLRQMIRYVGYPLLGLVVWDFLIVFAYKVMHWEWVGSKSIPLALYGSVIGIIVGFRNNSAYSRWWEARTLWGAIVNNSRSIARQVYNTVRCRPDASEEDVQYCAQLRAKIIHLQIAFVHALRQQLRGLDPIAEVRSVMKPNELSDEEIAVFKDQKNVALGIQRMMGVLLREAHHRGWTNALEWQAADHNLDDLADAQGASERIKNTPLPKQYDYFPMLFVRIYCIVLPIGMVESLGWFTPLGSTIVGFMFLALDKIGRDLEDPFDNRIYDVALTSICKTIEINLRQLLDEKDLPAPETPINGVLW